jgi:hypothetical protein
MILLELFNQYPNEFQDLSQDDSQLKMKDTRKTRLTLAHINRLRKMNDMRALEHAKEMQLIQQMYGASAQAEGTL